MRLLAPIILLALVCGVSPAADVDQLLKDLKDKDAKKRVKAATDLATVTDDDKAATALCEATNDPSSNVSKAALESLSKVRPDLYKHISTIVLDSNHRNRAEAAASLGGLGAKAKPAVRSLAIVAVTNSTFTGNVKDSSDIRRVGYEATKAIVAIGVTDADVADALAKVAVSPHAASSRKVAYEAIVAWAKESGNTDALFAVSKSWLGEADGKSHTFAVAACKALADFGAPAMKEFGPTLEKLKISKEKTVRDAAVDALGKLSK